MTLCAQEHPLDPNVLCGQPAGHLLQGLPHLPASGVGDQDVEPWGLAPFTPALTHRQRAVLDFIRSSVEARGFPPTVQEIADELGLASKSSVHHHLRVLECKGFLRRVPGSARAMAVLSPGDLGAAS